MPAGIPNFGEGTVVEVDDGESDAFAPIVGLTSLESPDEESPVVNRQLLSATTYVKKGIGVPDAGNFTYEYELTDVEYVRNRALKRVERSFKVTYTDGLRQAFKAIVYSNKPNGVKAGNEFQTCKAMAVVTSLITVSDTVANS